ncbi:MAG: dephospho-CoA kinase [Chloroflexota bacterium]
MKVIGLTGNIGCGKSAVAAMLRRLGADYVDADLVVHALLGPGTAVTAAVARRFGKGILKPDGAVDRRALAAIVFADTRALRDLERITHPAVRAEVVAFLAASRAPVAVIEAIKLLESELRLRCDEIWVVTCNEGVQIDRLVASRNMLREEAHRRIAAQSPQAEKVAQANVVIANDGSLEETWRQVKTAWDRLTYAP